MLKFLGSSDGNKFTYDAPKFVEAVIRIARGNIRILYTEEVILRIDEDVTVYYKGIKALIHRYPGVMGKPFHCFSGTYGKYDKYGNPADDHPKNNYAVRVHFFIDPATRTLHCKYFFQIWQNWEQHSEYRQIRIVRILTILLFMKNIKE